MPQKTIIHLSDIHSDQAGIRKIRGDILLVSGDLSRSGTKKEIEEALAWIRGYPCGAKIVVPGNHDRWAFDHLQEFRKAAGGMGVTTLIDESYFCEGFHVYGMPWISCKDEWKWPESDSAWTMTEGDPALGSKVAAIPDGADILITHAPPKSVCDSPPPGSYFHRLGEPNPGCGELLRFLQNRQAPLLWCAGHVHGVSLVRQHRRTIVSNAARSVHRFMLEGNRVVSWGRIQAF